MLCDTKTEYRVEDMTTYGHSSSCNDRTLDRCEPRFLWIPEHSIHMRAPRFKLAHSGSETRADDIQQ